MRHLALNTERNKANLSLLHRMLCAHNDARGLRLFVVNIHRIPINIHLSKIMQHHFTAEALIIIILSVQQRSTLSAKSCTPTVAN